MTNQQLESRRGRLEFTPSSTFYFLCFYSLGGTRTAIIGGLGVSGDYSCADHNIAWKLRHSLELDDVPAGVDPTRKEVKTHDDSVVFDISAITSEDDRL